ncbi:MAG: hypothetical protein C0407_13545 [Desulfobacca sp.]|nr:hypothetical protein [Desulfobacca sp.]
MENLISFFCFPIRPFEIILRYHFAPHLLNGSFFPLIPKSLLPKARNDSKSYYNPKLATWIPALRISNWKNVKSSNLR